MKNTSLWLDTVEPRQYAALKGDVTCDVAVIGAGLTGITTAVLLAQTGAKVVVIEADCAGSGTTGYTTAKVTVQHGLKLQQLGEDKAHAYMSANQTGLELIAKLVKENDIECDFIRQPAYIFTRTEDEIKYLDKEKLAYDRLGIRGEMTTNVQLPFSVVSALKVDNQAQFHPMKFLYALIDMLTDSGGSLYEHTMARDIAQGNPCIVYSDMGKISADNVVIATNYPMIDFPGLYFIKLHQERSYIISTNADKVDMKGMYISAGRPVNSVRMHFADAKNELLLGGYGHKTGQEETQVNAYDSLQKFLRDDFVKAKPKPSHGWSAQDCVTLDGLPYVGAISKKIDNIYVATGYAKWGMTNAAVAAMMITDAISGSDMVDTSIRKVFIPGRFAPGASAKDFLVQTGHAIKEYTAGNVAIPVSSYEDVAPGTGAVLRIDGKAQAVYRDRNGKLNAFNAHCTHLSCPLEYNEADKSFDCSCHGSRFAMDGSVIEGPAKLPLKRIEDE